MLQKLFRKSPLFLSKERLRQMLISLEKEESLSSLKELVSVLDSSPELIPQKSLFKIINHTSCLQTIKTRSIEQIKADPKHFSSLRKTRAFTQKSSENPHFLRMLEDVQKVIEEGKSLRRTNPSNFQDSVEEVLEEARSLEKEFSKLPEAMHALLANVGFLELKEDLKKFQEDGDAYLQEVDKVLGVLEKKFSIEDEPINKRLGFSWGIFLKPLIENLEPVVQTSKVEEELSLSHLYRDLVRARAFVEKHRLSFIDWIEKRRA
jgi:hypothetical protein